MERVLVTGGAGYIGSHVCKALHQAGLVPVAFDDLSSGKAHAVRWGELEQADIRDGARLEQVFGRHRPVAVIHLAGRIEIAEGERDPLAFWSANVAGSLVLLDAMRTADCRFIVNSSTCAVYDGSQDRPIAEDAPLAPASVYGRTKLAVEGALADAGRAGTLVSASLRYFNAAGASQEGEIGEEHDPETHLIPRVLAAAAGRSAGVEIYGEDYPTPDGTCVRDYIHVEDLAAAHVAALDRLRSREDSFVCNLGAGKGISVREVIDTVERVTGKRVPWRAAPRRPGDTTRLVADITRARDRLGFVPARSDIETIIADAWCFHTRQWSRS